jgi:hypothetical protein
MLRKLFERHRCSGFLIDHSNRRGEYYGSAQRKAAIRMMWHVDRLADGDRLTNTIRVRCAKPGEAEPFEPFMVEFDFTGDLVSIRPIEVVPKRASNTAGKLKAELRDWGCRQEKPFSKNAAVKAIGGRAEDARVAIEALIEQGEWIVAGEHRKHPLYAAATSSGTRWDEVDEVQAVPGTGLRPYSALPIGDEVRDEVDGRGANGWSLHGQICSSCGRIGVVRESDGRCRECVEAA